MRLMGLAVLAVTATWLLTIAWRPLGLDLSYWQTAPLGFAAILLFAVMATLMSVGIEPVGLDTRESDAVAEILPLRRPAPTAVVTTSVPPKAAMAIGPRRIGDGIGASVGVTRVRSTERLTPLRPATPSRASG